MGFYVDEFVEFVELVVYFEYWYFVVIVGVWFVEEFDVGVWVCEFVFVGNLGDCGVFVEEVDGFEEWYIFFYYYVYF